MHKLFNKIDQKLSHLDIGGSSGNLSSNQDQNAQGGSPPDVSRLPDSALHYRFRKQRGVNLGSWFSLETWLTGSVFEGVNDPKSEVDLNKQLDASDVKERLHKHWGSFINDGDWNWMVQHGVNTVRLPIAYFHFLPDLAPGLMKNTEYEKFADTYKGAWDYIKGAIETAAQHGIGVLIDLHGAPGGQNTDGHVGITTDKAALWDGIGAKANQKKTVAILVELVKAVGTYDNVVGVELLNEPKNGPHLTAFYDAALGPIRHADKNLQVTSLPIYVSDAWTLDWYTEQFGGNVRCRPLNQLVVDHHLYRAFTGEDHKTRCAQHAAQARPVEGGTYKYFKSNSDKGNGNLIVGEWSAALHHTSFDANEDKRTQQADWAQSQLALFEHTCGGNFYWTLKKEGGKDVGWCFYSAVEEGVMPDNLLSFALGRDPGQAPPEDQAGEAGEQQRQASLAGHSGWWDKQGGHYEHWRYEDGFKQAWADATQFWYHPAGPQPANVGYKKSLAQVRQAAYDAEKGSSGSSWEFEHGYLAGIDTFEKFLRGQL